MHKAKYIESILVGATSSEDFLLCVLFIFIYTLVLLVLLPFLGEYRFI